MTDRHADESVDGQEGGGRSLKRRGILAAAGAVVAGIAVKQAVQPVAAATFFQFANTAARVGNNALEQTDLFATLSINHVALNVDASASGSFDGIGVLGAASGGGMGLVGLSAGVPFPGAHQFAGVFGKASDALTGVKGFSSGNGNGVEGQCYGATGSIGLNGLTDLGVGVRGGQPPVRGCKDRPTASPFRRSLQGSMGMRRRSACREKSFRPAQIATRSPSSR